MTAPERLGTATGPRGLALLSGRGPRLSLCGEVDHIEAAAVAGALVDAAAAAPGDVALDLSGLDFLDVAGARALAGAVRLLAERGVTVRLVGARSTPARCLELFGLTSGPVERP